MFFFQIGVLLPAYTMFRNCPVSGRYGRVMKTCLGLTTAVSSLTLAATTPSLSTILGSAFVTCDVAFHLADLYFPGRIDQVVIPIIR